VPVLREFHVFKRAYFTKLAGYGKSVKRLQKKAKRNVLSVLLLVWQTAFDNTLQIEWLVQAMLSH
jgi:hypothetical protein